MAITPTVPENLLDPPADAPPGHLPALRAFIEACRFTYAKSVPDAPHEYCLRAWVPDEHQAGYSLLRDLIAEYGYRGRFRRITYRYLNVDGYRYWESKTIDRTGDIINRALNAVF